MATRNHNDEEATLNATEITLTHAKAQIALKTKHELVSIIKKHRNHYGFRLSLPSYTERGYLCLSHESLVEFVLQLAIIVDQEGRA